MHLRVFARLRSFAVQHMAVLIVWKVELEIKSVGLKSERTHNFVVILAYKETFLP